MKNSEVIAQLQEKPWKQNDNPIWLATTLTLHRNVNKHLFPGKLDKTRQTQLLSLIQQFIGKTPLLASELSHIEKEFLFEHFLTGESFHEAHSSEGFVIDESSTFLAIINIKDHLQLHVVDCKQDLENSWNLVVELETELGKNLNYSFSPRFGFLTANSRHCGSGLIVRAYLHVPALAQTNYLSQVLENEMEEGIAAGSLQGDLSEIVGDIITLYNTLSLGSTEEEILKAIRVSATKVMVAEKSAREQLKTQEAPMIKNLVSRAFGLITHSYQLETVEALNALSLCKLALELGWIKGIELKKLNELFFTCRRGHLQTIYPEALEHEGISKKRAEHLHSAFQGTTLLV